MPGLVSSQVPRKMAGPTPTLLPKKKRKEQRVFLDPEMWDELTAAAEFHQAAFEVVGADEKVSRNDIIESFLSWALESYWDDKGGKPASKDDYAKKVGKLADAIRESQKNAAKKLTGLK